MGKKDTLAGEEKQSRKWIGANHLLMGTGLTSLTHMAAFLHATYPQGVQNTEKIGDAKKVKVTIFF